MQCIIPYFRLEAAAKFRPDRQNGDMQGRLQRTSIRNPQLTDSLDCIHADAADVVLARSLGRSNGGNLQADRKFGAKLTSLP